MKSLIRWGFGLSFAADACVHLYLVQTQPESYGVFGAAAVPPLDALWQSFVMPNIRGLTIVMAAIEVFIATGLLVKNQLRKPAVLISLAFFAFLLPLGYGRPTNTLLEDVLKNRLGSVIMFAAMALLLPGVGGDARR